jgi:hypothetical protein
MNQDPVAGDVTTTPPVGTEVLARPNGNDGTPPPLVFAPAFGKTAEGQQCDPIIEMDIGMLRIDLDGDAIGLKRLFQAAHLLEGYAEVDQDTDLTIIDRQRPAIGFQHLVEPRELEKSGAEIEQNAQMPRICPLSTAKADKGIGMAALPPVVNSHDIQGIDVIGLERQRALELRKAGRMVAAVD